MPTNTTLFLAGGYFILYRMYSKPAMLDRYLSEWEPQVCGALPIFKYRSRVDLVFCRASCTEKADSEILLGHMFNQHYLDPMFPLSKFQKLAAKEKKGVKWDSERKAASHNEGSIRDVFDELFLDRIVSPDERLAMQREFTAIAELGVARRESGLEFGSGQVLKDTYGPAKFIDASGDESLTFKRTASDRVVAEEARGKTVKDLSRLWKYLGGNSPVDHDHSEDGYHDGSSHEHRKHRHHHHHQRKADQEPGDGSVLEQQNSPISSGFDRPKSPFPHPSPTTDEQSFHVSSFSEPFSRHSQGNLG